MAQALGIGKWTRRLVACCLVVATWGLIPWSSAQPPQVSPGPPLACLGEARPLVVSSGMPYTLVRVRGRDGFFVVDLGSDGSAISPGTFLPGSAPDPRPLPGSADWFEGVDFLGLPEKASPGEKAAKLNELGSRQKILTLQSVDT
ncbi:MAG: hypothetical protein ACK41W_16125 [Cyanobacteriota bacterium]|jgi:hypothetical protein